MRSDKLKQIVGLVLLASLALANHSCNTVSSNEEFFGSTTPPTRNIFRYVSGDEPETLDPTISNGQPEARLYLGLYEGLVEYNPKTLAPEPALAERWHINNDSSEFTFHLRNTGRWSNGDPIDANDFVYSFRRAVAKETASKNASMTYYLKYAQAYNEKRVFVRDPATGQFLLAKDLSRNLHLNRSAAARSRGQGASIFPMQMRTTPDPDSAFHHVMHTPQRLTLPGDEKARNKRLAADAKLKEAVAGKEFVPVKAEDIGVEAVDKYTLRISLSQQAPFFLGLLAHQVYRHRAAKSRGTVRQQMGSCGTHRYLWSIQGEALEALRSARARTRSDVLGHRECEVGRDLFVSDHRQLHRDEHVQGGPA